MSETPSEKMARLANETVEQRRRQKEEQEQIAQQTRQRLAAQDTVELRRVIAELTGSFESHIEQAVKRHIHFSGTALTFSVFGLFQGHERDVLNELEPLFRAVEKAEMQPFTLRQTSSNGCYAAGTPTLLGRMYGGPGPRERWDNELENGGFLRLTSLTPTPPHEPPSEFGWLPAAKYAHRAKFGTETVAVGARWAKGPAR